MAHGTGGSRRPGVRDAAVGKPGVQFLVACEARRRREESLTHVAHLVLSRVILSLAAPQQSGAASMTLGNGPLLDADRRDWRRLIAR
jgi:hypothetical protein